MEHATNLREVIEQLERGDVQHIRDMYGPQKGRMTDRMWSKVKVTINHLERLYHQLKDAGELDGDKERFFGFFTVTCNLPAQGRKRKATEDDSEMVPYRRVVETIPHPDKDIREERENRAYQDENRSFSIKCWHEKWGNANHW